MARELPHSIEAEQSILGAMLIYPSVSKVVFDQNLEEEDFYLDVHRRIFKEMMVLLEAGKPVDVTGLITRLSDGNQLNMVGGADYVVKLSDTAVSGANSKYYIEIIKDRSHLRRLIETAEKIAADGFESGNELDGIMDQAEKEILDVTRSRRATDFKNSKDVVTEVIDEIAELRAADSRITGLKSGFEDLDKKTNGFQKGDLIILAARPAMGKTAFALNLAANCGQYANGAIAIFSLEMGASQLMKRILSSKSKIESSKLRSGYVNDKEFNKLCESANEIMSSKLFIDDSASIKMSEVFSKCRKLKSEHDLSLIVIDYLQLISGSGKGGGDNRQQEVSEISRNLKALARELEVPVIALSQLSRSVESRKEDKRPMLSDLRESGAIEQDADIVMFLYREAYYAKPEDQKDETKEDRTEIIIAKHRNGATGTVELAFDKSISLFINYKGDSNS
ncbi:MAG: replicative DNA helicase [Erysipelotrichaceae bacterium]